MIGLILAGALAAGPMSAADGGDGGGNPAGGNPTARLLLLPDIAAVGRGALVWDQRDVATLSPRGEPIGPPGKVQPVFQELEVSLQAVVDSYLRADIFLSFSPEGAGVEEAYVTTLGLPAGLQLRAGTLKAPFGRQNQQHPHVWDFADAPLAQARLVAVEALGGPGLDVAWLVPAPWFAELHLAYQEVKPGFEAEGRRAGVARLIQYFDVTDDVALGVGLSGARLDEPGAGSWRDLYGGDLFLKIRPGGGRAYLALQGELFDRRLMSAAAGGPLRTESRSGGYLQATLRASSYWGGGLRWESAPAADATGAVLGGGREQRWSAIGSWFPSEFQRLRLQVARDLLPGGAGGWEAVLALEFTIGAHGAHPF